MKTNQTKKNISQKQSLSPRVRQVRRQKLLILICGFLAALFLLFALFFRRNGNSSSQLTINASCEAYRPQVEEIAKQYDMSAYVDLILALMMQESSGVGPDVLQSSEGAYNTQYPQEPGGITDSTYSIQCGIQELKYALEQAGVTSPTDISHIQVALQAYNFGADVYLSYMKKNQETSWSVESAEAFAQIASGDSMRSEDNSLYNTAGPWNYGDQHYPEHVLRYYHPLES